MSSVSCFLCDIELSSCDDVRKILESAAPLESGDSHRHRRAKYVYYIASTHVVGLAILISVDFSSSQSHPHPFAVLHVVVAAEESRMCRGGSIS